ncbi:hypothetical protein MRX96_034844 [Rhipicephalus microplus]
MATAHARCPDSWPNMADRCENLTSVTAGGHRMVQPKSDDDVTDWDQPGTSSTVPVHAWLAPFDDMTQVTLVSLSINLEGWKPDDYTVLFFAAAVIESLKTIVVSGVYLSALPRVCRTIRDAGVGEKVHMKNEYVISPVTLTLPEDCREQINHIVAVFSNETIDQLDVSSSDSSENEELLRLFAAGFETNQTLLRIRLPNCGGDYSEVLRRANVEAIMSRNVGYVTCAAHYVAWNTDQRRCMKALLCVSKSPALIDKVKELLQFDEDDAKKLVVSRLSEASTVR